MHKTITLRVTQHELNVLKLKAHAERLSVTTYIIRILDNAVDGFKAPSSHSAVKPTQPASPPNNYDIDDLVFEEDEDTHFPS